MIVEKLIKELQNCHEDVYIGDEGGLEIDIEVLQVERDAVLFSISHKDKKHDNQPKPCVCGKGEPFRGGYDFCPHCGNSLRIVMEINKD